ncbi:MAG: hypothetical protein ACE5EM_01155 [Sphingomonadales bacterium]
MEFFASTETGDHDVSAHARKIGEDVLVAIWGGDKPHIGAVAAAQPRPSLDDRTRTSASTSVICFVGHKEDDLAKHAAQTLASALKVRVVVTAGIHWDNITPDGIKSVRCNCKSVIAKVADLLSGAPERPETA